MKFNSQIYLDCYNNLHSPQGSKQANKTLLEIYESDQAWKIAEQLMLNQSHIIHGSQLLSQKLNSSLPPEVNPQVLAQFILSLKTINNLHWLCLAKIFIHTHQSIDQLQIQGNLGIDIKLNILKEIPHAFAQLRIQFGVKSSDYKTEAYKQNQNIILEAIKFLAENKKNSAPEIAKLQDLVFQVLQSLTQCYLRLNCEEIARFVLQFSDSDRVSNLFEHIFLEQRYPNLDQKIQIFLKENLKNEDKDWIKAFYLNFYAKRDIFSIFSIQKYTQVLRTATLMMATEQEDEFRSILSDSYEFWLSLINRISNTKISLPQSNQLHQRQTLLKQSLFVIFQQLCKHSKLKKCPSIIKKIQSNLDIIDLESQEGIVQSKMGSNFQDEFSELNYNVNQIRQMSMDLLIKIQEGLKNDHALYRKIFQSLFLLASSQNSRQELELAIFIVDGMTDCCDECSKPFLSDLIKVILDQKSMQNEYVCQRIVILLGKIDKIIVSNVTMLPSVFQFFSNSIAYEKLSSLASESFKDLMDQYQVQNFMVDQQFKEKSQTYLNFWFETFYGKIKTEKVLENITMALVIFIYKFKGPEYYQKFLIMMNQKINSQSDQSLKHIYLESVVSGQNWINSRQNKEDRQYLIVFSNFMNQFLDILVKNCFKANRKPDFTRAVGKINWAIKAGSYFLNIERWLQMIKQIINKSLFQLQGDVLSVGLTPLITIMKNQYLDIKNLNNICQTLETVLTPITSLFINFHQRKTSLDYNFTKYVLQIHNLTVAMILKYPQITQNSLINYDPETIFVFIKEKIFKNKNFWQFQVYKETLIFIHELILSNYRVQDICFEVLGICGRTLESLWIQTENVFLSVYKKLGINPFINSLQKIKPEVLAPNPLFSLLQQGLQTSDRKILKSFVRCM